MPTPRVRNGPRGQFKLLILNVTTQGSSVAGSAFAAFSAAIKILAMALAQGRELQAGFPAWEGYPGMWRAGTDLEHGRKDAVPQGIFRCPAPFQQWLQIIYL